MENRQWATAGVRNGFHENVGVWANRYVDPSGEVAWHVRVVPPNATKQNAYFVVRHEFYASLRTDTMPGGKVQITTSGEPIEVDPLQKAAALTLIRRWEEGDGNE